MAHERIRHLVLNVKREALRDRYGSYRKFAQACGMNPSTITDMINGRAWPSSLTIAKIETEIGVMMWPTCQ
ncbi:helix-turn-helix domain-containing protein [Corynebacterium sp. LaCa116]|uniref:helix-turn-helix domain-containing protein n=1 Tax=Corynebacterium sp. LaCa116 TaxID=3391423 RepID=UPI0039899A9E